MDEIFGPHRAWLTMRIRSRSSRRIVPTIRSQIAFARGACGGVLMICMVSAVKTASNAPVNRASRSWMRNGSVPARSPRPRRMLDDHESQRAHQHDDHPASPRRRRSQHFPVVASFRHGKSSLMSLPSFDSPPPSPNSLWRCEHRSGVYTRARRPQVQHRRWANTPSRRYVQSYY
jgi:hypothetical protein